MHWLQQCRVAAQAGWKALWVSAPRAELNPDALLTIENLMVFQPGTEAGLIRREYGAETPEQNVLPGDWATGHLPSMCSRGVSVLQPGMAGALPS